MEYTITPIDSDLFVGINLVLKDADMAVQGGIVGKTDTNIAYIEHLWVGEAHQRKDLGTRLLRQFEAIAHAKGCYKVLVDTFDTQAPVFYEKNAYQLDTIVEEPIARYKRFYYSKLLK
jgi:GNAT superfamily N-acetyltransferase